MPEIWSSTANWYRDEKREQAANALLKAQGIDPDARFATLDAVPAVLEAWSDMALSLGCIAGAKAVYLLPYSLSVPEEVDTYAIGVWDEPSESWMEGDVYFYRNPTLTDDGSGIYVFNQAQVRQIVSVLHKAAQLQNSDQFLNTLMYGGKYAGGDEWWGRFNIVGLDDALAYLPCF